MGGRSSALAAVAMKSAAASTGTCQLERTMGRSSSRREALHLDPVRVGEHHVDVALVVDVDVLVPDDQSLHGVLERVEHVHLRVVGADEAADHDRAGGGE